MERAFLLSWLCSAALVTFARLLHPTELNYDLTWQIQAAQHLVSGKGLAVYAAGSNALQTPLPLQPLTYFPAAYSLYAAAILALGAPVGALVKLLGACATMLGWWGWARLAFTFMGDGMRRSRRWRAAAYAVAVVSPLLYTIPWGGTDIVLWAAVPWIVELLTSTRRLYVLAGALVGLCVLTRYASLFLPVYGVLVIVMQDGRTRAAARHLVAFIAGMIPMVAFQGYLSYVVASVPAAPAGVLVTAEGIQRSGTRAWETLASLSGVNNGLWFFLPSRIQAFWSAPRLEPFALALAVVVIGIAIVALVRTRVPRSVWSRDPRVVAGGCLLAVPLFLWVCGLFGPYALVHVTRYYWPLRPLTVCIAFALATRLPAMTRAYVVAFLVMAAAGVAMLFEPGERGDNRRQAVLGYSRFDPSPSFRLTYDASAARALAVREARVQPETILVTHIDQWFNASPEVDRSRLRRWQKCPTEALHVSGPARVVALLPDASSGHDDLRQCLERLPGLTVVQRFPEERLQVLEARVPDGATVQLVADAAGRARAAVSRE
jgi:hypothetical protein